MNTQTILKLLTVTPILLLASCSSPTMHRRDHPLTGGPIMQALLNPGKLSPETEAYLKEKDLLRSYRKDPAGAITALQNRVSKNPSRAERITLIELCSDTADSLAQREPRRAVAFHLSAAELAYPSAMASKDASPSDPFVTAYNHSAGRVAQILFEEGHDWNASTVLEGPGKNYRLRCRTTGKGFISPAFFDQLLPASYLDTEEFKMERIVVDGIGGAMVGHRAGTPERREANPFLPPNLGMSLPVNAALVFSSDRSEVELAFRDLLVQERAVVAGRERTLAADFTASLLSLTKYQTVRNLGMKALLHPQEYVEQMGLLQLEPFRPDQIPVVFVHGLMSSPGTWIGALNGLRADPVLRKRYQLFAFRYPSGFPIARNAAAFRKHLRDFQEFYDPKRRNPNMRNMIVIGHSMGGILTNAQIRSSGDTITKQLFDRPIDELGGLADDQRAKIKEIALYEPSPDITRVVYMASPHRGSELSTGKIGAFGRRLINFPAKVSMAQTMLRVEGLTDSGRHIVNSRPDSIESLNPGAPILEAILEQPVRRGVKIHSIIGNHKMTSPLNDSTDTVVPYWSAHLDEAVSEKVVDAKHTTITHDPVAVEEVRRILYLHAGEHYPGPMATGHP